jgi:hypothetical protein
LISVEGKTAMKNICIFAEILNWSFYGVRDGENPEGRWPVVAAGVVVAAAVLVVG